MNFRAINLWVHRYIGLATAIFLVLTGVSGALLVFEPELDDWFNQKLAYVESQPNMPQYPIARLHDKVVQTFPAQSFSSMPTQIMPNRAVVFSVDRQKGKPPKQSTKSSSMQSLKKTDTPKFQQVFVNPYTAEIIGTRDRDQWAWHNTMYKVFWFHRNLLLGEVGQFVLGLSALLWTLNCLVGLYLTFPQSKNKPSNDDSVMTRTMNWGKKWRRAWRVRRFSSWFKLNFDLHHAFGLWFWLLALAVAWSSVGFNLKSVYQPVMMAVFGQTSANLPPKSPSTSQQSLIPMTYPDLKIDKYQAIDTLVQYANTASANDGKHFERAIGLRWIGEETAWQLRFKTSEDVGNGRGVSSLTVNALTGDVTKINFGSQAIIPTKLEHWWYSLHMGHFDALIYRIVLALFGLVTAIMSMTGVYLWWRGWQGRRKRKRKRQHQSHHRDRNVHLASVRQPH